MIAGLEAAGRFGANPLRVCMDSQLVIRQMTGQYRVKNAGLKPLHAQAREAARKLKKGGSKAKIVGAKQVRRRNAIRQGGARRIDKGIPPDSNHS